MGPGTPFREQLRQFTVTLATRERAVFTGVVLETQRSIVDGSELTGAPGQPVKTGALKASWQSHLEGATTAIISTNIQYAPYIEDGGNSRGPFTFRHGGGAHSVALTATNFDRIVKDVTARVTAGGTALPMINAQTGYRGEEGG